MWINQYWDAFGIIEKYDEYALNIVPLITRPSIPVVICFDPVPLDAILSADE